MRWDELVVIDHPDPADITPHATTTLSRYADQVVAAEHAWAEALHGHGIAPSDADRYRRALHVAADRAARPPSRRTRVADYLARAATIRRTRRIRLGRHHQPPRPLSAPARDQRDHPRARTTTHRPHGGAEVAAADAPNTAGPAVAHRPHTRTTASRGDTVAVGGGGASRRTRRTHVHRTTRPTHPHRPAHVGHHRRHRRPRAVPRRDPSPERTARLDRRQLATRRRARTDQRLGRHATCPRPLADTTPGSRAGRARRDRHHRSPITGAKNAASPYDARKRSPTTQYDASRRNSGKLRLSSPPKQQRPLNAAQSTPPGTPHAVTVAARRHR